MIEVGIDYLKKMIEGKRVALIGPAEYVCKELGKEHGRLIDNYDVVIRLNGMINYPNKELENYYGKRIDILASSFWYTKERDYELNKKISGDKYYKGERYANPSNYQNINKELLLFENMPRRLFERIYNSNNEMFDNKNNLKYHCITASFSNKTHNFLYNICHLNKGTTTGMLTIANILLCGPKKLYISGLTFYKDTKYKAYYNDYHERKEGSENYTDYYNNTVMNGNIISESVKLMTGHNIKGEQEIFNNLIMNKKIKVDNYLFNLYN